MIEYDFRSIYRELIEENPLAVRAVLKVLEIEFTTDVPTLAVTCSEAPVLKVNLDFVTEQCAQESHVKALIVHEFLHILLRHTMSSGRITPERHLATDAVINAIIHRQLGEEYSGLMSHYYREEKGVRVLLRPPTQDEEVPLYFSEIPGPPTEIARPWRGLYDGKLCADDIEEIASDFRDESQVLDENLLGDHQPKSPDGSPLEEDPPLPKILEQALDRSLEAMNGDGIWRSPHERGVGAVAYQREVLESNECVDRWCRATFAVLKRHVDPASNGTLTGVRPVDYLLPVLSGHDRRAVLRSLWSPFLPEARWQSERTVSIGGTQVYLDVSGSMDAEMPLIVKLLGRLARYIQRPFWAFSNEVAPAVIQNRRLIADTTGGTSMACVLEHIAPTQPPAAVVLTDGYIEKLPPSLVRSIGSTRLHAIVTRDGSAALLEKVRIPFTQLGRIPQ
jgi:hypothetical protein